MNFEQLRRLRLANQSLTGSKFKYPAEMVEWLGAVQAQDYPAASWALSIRSSGLTQVDVDKALLDGSILRTHVLRPTWHFVTPADIRWMLKLTGPRILAATASRHRRLRLDEATFEQCKQLVLDNLSGSRRLTRNQIFELLNAKGIDSAEQRGVHILMQAELTGLITSGGLDDNQQTYALLDERVPKTKELTRTEAVSELVRCYFFSHGPATIKDFVWWSGLTAADAKLGLEARKSLESFEIDGVRYWTGGNKSAANIPSALLLPNYDEYIVSYANRSALMTEVPSDRLDARGNVLFNHTILIDGIVDGTWRRVIKGNQVIVELKPFRPLTPFQQTAIAAEAERFGRFLGKQAIIKTI